MKLRPVYDKKVGRTRVDRYRPTSKNHPACRLAVGESCILEVSKLAVDHQLRDIKARLHMKFLVHATSVGFVVTRIQ